MATRRETTKKKTAISRWEDSQKFWMAESEYTGMVVGKDATDSEYVISNGTIAPGASIPDHYHKWEDQTFHIIEGQLEIKIGDEVGAVGRGDSIHCPRGVSHYMKNISKTQAKLISYIFPGDWAEDFMAETSRQNQAGERDLGLIEERFGVVYL
jgi:quercetin dioxygenase-like cupin family protein